MTLAFSRAERQVLAELRVRGAFHADEDVVRCALYKLAVHFDLATDAKLFALRPPRRDRLGGGAA